LSTTYRLAPLIDASRPGRTGAALGKTVPKKSSDSSTISARFPLDGAT
jgi:hypothetical protein